MNLEERFWSKVDIRKSDDCWIWKAAKSSTGYGTFCIENKTKRAHRIAYILINGEINNDILVCHKCDNPPCVNPNHLFLGTDKDNYLDMVSKNRRKISAGINSGNAKFANCDIIEIRNDNRTHMEIATEYGVDRSTIGYIKRNKTWKHV